MSFDAYCAAPILFLGVYFLWQIVRKKQLLSENIFFGLSLSVLGLLPLLLLLKLIPAANANIASSIVMGVLMGSLLASVLRQLFDQPETVRVKGRVIFKLPLLGALSTYTVLRFFGPLHVELLVWAILCIMLIPVYMSAKLRPGFIALCTSNVFVGIACYLDYSQIKYWSQGKTFLWFIALFYIVRKIKTNTFIDEKSA